MSEPQILARREGAVGRVTLNRPGALHALTTAMCEELIAVLQGWKDDPEVALVLIDHSGERGFCAGGDIRVLAESGAGDGAEVRRFFFTEYQLDALLMAYAKPVCAVMDGLVMGGGVGISLPARYRIATERTVFAMPETGIGLFPDVGGGWHLPRLPGESGLWLGLTGARVRAADCLRLGITTHCVESARTQALKAAIVADPAAIETTLANFASDPGPAPVEEKLVAIDAAFSRDSVEAILEALADDGSAWALAQREALLTKSPLSLKVAFRQLRTGRRLAAFEADMAMEHRIAMRLATRHDFLEGVRAVIIDKDNAPRWSPPTLGAVTRAMVDGIFAPLPPAEEWTPLGEAA